MFFFDDWNCEIRTPSFTSRTKIGNFWDGLMKYIHDWYWIYIDHPYVSLFIGRYSTPFLLGGEDVCPGDQEWHASTSLPANLFFFPQAQCDDMWDWWCHGLCGRPATRAKKWLRVIWVFYMSDSCRTLHEKSIFFGHAFGFSRLRIIFGSNGWDWIHLLTAVVFVKPGWGNYAQTWWPHISIWNFAVLDV